MLLFTETVVLKTVLEIADTEMQETSHEFQFFMISNWNKIAEHIAR